jgi:hypothetical protein
MERRVNTVELRPISLLTSSQVAAIVAGGESLDAGPDTIVSLSAPNQYKRIIEGYYYSNLLTGEEPRVELYFSADTGLDTDKTIRVEGIHQLDDNGTPVEFRVSSDYKTLSVDTPPWEERDSFNNTRHTPGSNVTNTALFSIESGNEYSSRKSLIVSREITFSEATITTAKLTFNSTNYFQAGDVVYVDMPSTSLYYGIDGLFTVKEAGSNFITYDFSTPLAEPINSAAVTGNRSVYAVARSATRDGATWINTSTDPDTIYAWKGIRWITYSTGDVTKDEIAPGPVTNLAATSANDTPDGNAIGLSRVTLTWTAPENSADDTPIDDLIGYTIWWRQYATQEWQKADITGADTTFSVGGFEQGSAAYFRVFARDASGNRSTGVDITHTTGRSDPVIGRPGPPVVESYLGTIKVSYDDLTALGNVQSGTAKEVQVYFSTVDDFDIESPGAYYGKFAAGNRSFLIIPGNELVHDTDYYFKINVRDIYGNVTEPSAQVSVRAQLEDIVTYNMLEVGSLDGQSITGLQIQTNDNPGVNGGIILNKQQLIAYAPPGGVGGSASQTFRIDAATGAVTIGAYLATQEAEGLYLGKEDAKTEYSTNVRADEIELKATNAATSASAADGKASTALTRIEAGTITVTKEKAIGAINDGVEPGNTTTINGGSIKTGTIEASAIKAGTLDAGVVYAGEISADKIKGGTITADLINTTSLNATNIKSGTLAAERISTTDLNASNLKSGTIASARITADSIAAGVVSASKITAGTLVGRTIRTTDSTARAVIMDAPNNELRFLTLSGAVGGQITGETFPYNCVVMGGNGGGSFTAGNGRAVMNSSGGSYIDVRSTVIRFVSAGITPGFLFEGDNSSVRIVNLDGTGSASVSVTSLGTLFRSTSDSRLKKDIKEDVPGLDFINDLRPVSFKWKENTELGDKTNFGLIAQEVVEALDKHGILDQNIVYKQDKTSEMFKDHIPDEDTPYGFEYQPLISLLIKSVQELSNKIDVLEAKVNNQ